MHIALPYRVLRLRDQARQKGEKGPEGDRTTAVRVAAAPAAAATPYLMLIGTI